MLLFIYSGSQACLLFFRSIKLSRIGVNGRRDVPRVGTARIRVAVCPSTLLGERDTIDKGCSIFNPPCQGDNIDLAVQSQFVAR